MSSTAFKTSLALHLFNNSAIATLGDASGVLGSATAGNLYIALHTADPGAAGTQATSEAAYTGYARLPVARSAAGFTCVAGAVSNTGALEFGSNASGQVVITHFSIGAASSGAGMILASGAVSFTCPTGVAPRFIIGALTATVS